MQFARYKKYIMVESLSTDLDRIKNTQKNGIIVFSELKINKHTQFEEHR